MSEELENLEKQIEEKITNANTLDDLNSIRVEVVARGLDNHRQIFPDIPDSFLQNL